MIKSGTNQLPRQRLRVLPQQRLRREHLGEQPLGRRQAGAAAGHLRLHARRAGGPRPRCSSSATTRARARTRPASAPPSVAPEAWRRGDLSSVAAVIRDPQTGQPFPGNQIPTVALQPDRAGAVRRHGQLSAAQPHRAGRHRRQLRRRDAAQDPRPPGRRPRRLERLGQRQVLRPLLVRHLRGQARRQSRSRWCCRPATTSRSGTSAPTGTASSARPWSTSCWSASATPACCSETYDWAGIGAGNAALRHRRRPADRRPQPDQLRQRPDPARARSPPTPTRWPRPSRSTRS